MPTGLQLNQLLHKPEALAGFVERGSPVFRHPGAVGRYLQQLLLPGRIPAGRPLFLRQFRIPAGIPDHGLTAQDGRLQKLALGTVVRIPRIALVQFRLHLLNQSPVANGQDLVILHGHMPHAVIKIIARSENIVLHGLLRLLGHEGGGQFTGGFPFPVGVRLQKVFLGLLRYVERVRFPRGHGVELRLQPLIGKFRIGLAAPGCNGTAAHHQFVLPDNNGNVVKYMGKSQSAPHDNGPVLRRFIRFRDQLRPGGLDLRHFGVKMSYQFGDSLRFGNFFCVILCHCCSFPYPVLCAAFPLSAFLLLFCI